MYIYIYIYSYIRRYNEIVKLIEKVPSPEPRDVLDFPVLSLSPFLATSIFNLFSILRNPNLLY